MPSGNSKPAAPVVTSNVLRYTYPGLVQYYKNTKGGLEQGLTIARSPAGNAHKPLLVNFRFSSGLTAVRSHSGQAIEFRHGLQTAVTYGGLGVWDAKGKRLSARLLLETGNIQISIKDKSAAYPITVDPYFSAGELTAADGAASDAFGSDIALTSDGATALIGAYGHAGGGSAYVFTRDGTGYQQSQELRAPDSTSADCFGGRVALSADGAVAMASNECHNGNQGAVDVFDLSDGTYQFAQELSSPDGSDFGAGIGLSANGGDAIIGDLKGQTMDGSVWNGSVYLFARSESGYSQTEELADPTQTGSYFGVAVALSASGSEAIVGAVGHHFTSPFDGAAFVYQLTDGVATGSPQVLSAAGTALGSWSQSGGFGGAVALSADGDTALVGASAQPSSNPIANAARTGEAFVFSLGDKGFQQTGELAPPDGTDGDQFGSSVALSGDGTVALIGAIYATNTHCTHIKCTSLPAPARTTRTPAWPTAGVIPPAWPPLTATTAVNSAARAR